MTKETKRYIFFLATHILLYCSFEFKWFAEKDNIQAFWGLVTVDFFYVLALVLSDGVMLKNEKDEDKQNS